MIIVSPLQSVHALASEHAVSHIIGLLGPDSAHPDVGGIAPENHLKMTFNDISAAMDGMTAPGREHIAQIIEFARSWNRSAPLLVHCFAGISRSTATAYLIKCLLEPRADEDALAGELRRRSPKATPNRLMIAHADRLLGREGRMVAAIQQIGRGEYAFEGSVFTWPLSV